MFRLANLLLFLLIPVFGWSQTPLEVPLNSSTVFKDALGERISFDDFLEQTSGRGYEMSPVFDENNELKEVIVVKSSIASSNMKPGEFVNTVELIDRIPPDFEGVDIEGRYYNTENLAGKVLVLKFWFKACKPCIDEIPELNELVDQFRNNPEVVFLAPSLDKKPTVMSFLNRMPFKYSIIPDARAIAHNYNVPGYPTHVVINRFGKVKSVYLGVNHRIKDKLSTAIEYALLQTSPDPEVAKSSSSTIPPPEEEELFITPNSIIKNEAGEVIPFGKFVELMNEQQYQLSPGKDENGQEFILMSPIK